MIFGIKTRKELKKEIEDLKTKLDKAHFDLPLSRVNVVFDNRPIATLKAVIEISDHSINLISDDYIMDLIASKISEELRQYITLNLYHDPMELVHRFSGTLNVVVPTRGESDNE